MTIVKDRIKLSDLIDIACRGNRDDVVYLMGMLNSDSDVLTCKLVDCAIGQIETADGYDTIQDFLFNGNSLQRSYASLYFKRRKHYTILRKAVMAGVIDEVQAFSK